MLSIPLTASLMVRMALFNLLTVSVTTTAFVIYLSLRACLPHASVIETGSSIRLMAKSRRYIVSVMTGSSSMINLFFNVIFLTVDPIHGEIIDIDTVKQTQTQKHAAASPAL